MDSPRAEVESDVDIDALVEQIGDRLLERLGRPGESLSDALPPPAWSGQASALELDLSAAGHSDREIAEACRAAASKGIYAVWNSGPRLASAVRALEASETAVGALLSSGLSSVGKAAEAQNAIRLGAQAVEVPLDLGLARAADWDRVFADLRAAAEPTLPTGAALVVSLPGPDLETAALAQAAAVARLAGAHAVRVAGSATTHQSPAAEQVAAVAQTLGGEAETLSVGLDPSLLASGAARLSCSDALHALSAARG